MKFLLAAPKGTKANDFSWTEEGEPVGFPSIVCCNAASCGCNRSFSGLKTRKCTTLAVVGEIDTTIEKLAQMEAVGFFRGQVPADFEPNIADMKFLAAFAAKLPIGTKVAIKSTASKSKLFIVK